jgi:hypothetical protein
MVVQKTQHAQGKKLIWRPMIAMAMCLVVTVLTGFAAHATERQLNTTEIRQLLTGATYRQIRPITRSNSVVLQTFARNGQVAFSVNGTPQIGRWSAENNKMCWTFEGMREPDCHDVFQDGNQIRLVTPRGANYLSLRVETPRRAR